MGFEWQTNDDEGDEWREQRPTYRYRSARWRWILLGVVALLAAGIITWRLAERRVEASSEQMRADVRASHELVQRAAASSDVELLRTALSGRDEAWTETQRELVDEGYSYTAGARLLFLEPAARPEERALTLAPDLRSAELVLTQQYTPTAASTLSGPVVLEQTYTYRRGSNRWLLAPPDDAFWGAQRSTRSGRVVVEFPERDEALARRLADDLLEDVEALCGLQSGRCPPELVVTVTLEADPASLLAFADGTQMLRSGARVSLPAPSLLGIPQNDAGYRALHDAYARYLYAALAPQLTNWECCAQVLFWQTLLQARLHALGLAPPLLTAAESAAALDLLVDVDNFFITLSQKWQMTRPAGLHTPLPLDVRVLVAFLLDQGHTPLQLQLSMSGPTTAFHRWWSSFTGFAPTDRQEVRPALVSFVQAHYEPPPLPAGLALPGDDLLLTCGETTQTIWRYEPARETWTEVLSFDGSQLATVVTDEERYFVTSLQFGEEDGDETMSLSVWRVEPGAPPVLMADDAGLPWLALAKHGPVVPAAFFDPASGGEPLFGTVDLRTCDETSCARETAPGYVIPSPSGENELATRALFDSPGLFVRPAGGEWMELPQQGSSPFWLDDRTFAYLESASASFEQRVIANARLVVQTLDNESAVLVEARHPGLPGESDLFLHGFGAFYHAPSDRIYLLAGDQNQGMTALLAVSRPAGGSWLVPEPVTPETVVTAEGSLGFGIVPLAAQGRWLVLTLDQPRRQSPALWLIDLDGDMQPWTASTSPDIWLLPTYDWSPDGDWLAWLADGAIRLAAPTYRDTAGEPYQLLVPHDKLRCSFIAWLQR